MTATVTPLRVRPCVVCGRPSTRHWCSTRCYRADEPESDEPEDAA